MKYEGEQLFHTLNSSCVIRIPAPLEPIETIITLTEIVLNSIYFEFDKFALNEKEVNEAIDFIKKTNDVVESTRSLFSLTNDSELFGIVQALKVSLIENLDFLIEIQTDITDFINKIQFQLDVYKKAQQLKEIKDYGTLYFKSNFKEIVNGINSIKHNGHRAPKTKIAIDFLYSDDGHVLCKRISEKYKISSAICSNSKFCAIGSVFARLVNVLTNSADVSMSSK